MEQDQWVMDQLEAEAVEQDLMDLRQQPQSIAFVLNAGKK